MGCPQKTSIDENGNGKLNFLGHVRVIDGCARMARGISIASLSRATSGKPGLTTPSDPPESANKPTTYGPLLKKLTS
jgi:hypothetical protein